MMTTVKDNGFGPPQSAQNNVSVAATVRTTTRLQRRYPD